MSDPATVTKSLRDRLGANTDDRLGRALSELLESPLLTGAIGRAFDAREKAAQAQEVALGALNIPSAADIERLTRRLRSVSHRLEAIEDGVDRLDRALSPSGIEARLAAVESQLRTLTARVEELVARPAGGARTDGAADKKASSRSAKASTAPRQGGRAKGARRKVAAPAAGGGVRPGAPDAGLGGLPGG
jgi:hypothetical protein